MSKDNIKKFDVIIVGGGASGLFCASVLKTQNSALSVAVLEKQKSAGKKLLATGNGRCNLTNMNVNKDSYHGTFSTSVEEILNRLSPKELIQKFRSFGMLTTADSEGRVYPLSRQSSSVLDVLLLACKQNNINIISDTFVKALTKVETGFILNCNDNCYKCKKLVIATGSKATPETGADDTFWGILKNLGHNIISPIPALCPVNVKNKHLYNLKGVRATGNVKIMKNNKIIKSEFGEIQFTEKTLSGICLFNLARIANTTDNTYISVDLLPYIDSEEVLNLLHHNKKIRKNNSLAEDLLCGIFQKKLANTLLLCAGINKERPVNTISSEELKRLSHIIKDWQFEVVKTCDFTRAQVVAGGVNGSEINEHTMESKIIKDMYLIGEVIDCDGDCGGYNLHFAFASAYCAAKSISL